MRLINENICIKIQVSAQRPAAQFVTFQSASRDVPGSSSHVGCRFFEVSKSVIYDIITLQLFSTYKANIICL